LLPTWLPTGEFRASFKLFIAPLCFFIIELYEGWEHCRGRVREFKPVTERKRDGQPSSKNMVGTAECLTALAMMAPNDVILR